MKRNAIVTPSSLNRKRDKKYRFTDRNRYNGSNSLGINNMHVHPSTRARKLEPKRLLLFLDSAYLTDVKLPQARNATMIYRYNALKHILSFYFGVKFDSNVLCN